MPQLKPSSFSCAACGRKYPWKPELAGKRCKCKCGQVMTAPANIPQAVPAAGSAPKPAAPDICPSCASPLDEGAIVCISCGYNLETGAMMETELVQEAPLPAPPPTPAPGGARSKPAAPAKAKARSAGRGQDESTSNLKPLIIGAVAVVLLIAVIAGAKIYLKGNRKPARAYLGRDEQAMTMLQDDTPIEARQYLDANESYMLGVTWTKKQAHFRVDQWYGMGAKKVWAFAGVICRNVVVELPPEADKRKQLFDWVKQWDLDHMRKVQTDVGQQYLIIELM